MVGNEVIKGETMKREILNEPTKATKETERKKSSSLRRHDVAELLIGACILVFPIAMTERSLEDK